MQADVTVCRAFPPSPLPQLAILLRLFASTVLHKRSILAAGLSRSRVRRSSAGGDDHFRNHRLLLAAAEGRPAPRTGSMNSATNPRNPVAIVLAERAPEFIPWFERFRERRNEVKDGVNFGFTALAGEGISVTFNVFRLDTSTGRCSVFIDSSGDRKMTLADVLETARMLVSALSVLASSADAGPHQLEDP